MKYLASFLLFVALALPARGQLQQAPADPSVDAPPSTRPAIRMARSSPKRIAPFALRGSLGLTPYLEGLRAPSHADEFPAFVLTPFGERPVDLYSTRPTSVGGWLVRAAAETICQNNARGAASCGTIGARAYRYPRFRSTRYE